jgi:hypothetical protein
MMAPSTGCRVAGGVGAGDGFVTTPAHPASNSSHAETKNQANLFFTRITSETSFSSLYPA